MLQMSVELTVIEKKILSRGISVGNEVLYTLCKNYPLLKEKDMNEERRLQGLAAELWLIGRSYAASPERRNYGVKIELTNSGNGLDTYFDLLAKELCRYNEKDKINLKSIVNSLAVLNNKTYGLSSDSKANDEEILITVITAVLNFNRLLKEARFAVDFGSDDLDNIKNILKQNQKKLEDSKKDEDHKNAVKIEELLNKSKDIIASLNENQWNMLSFSSKFLHFHFPEVVFIMDSITKRNLKGSFSFTVNGKTEHSNIEITKYDKNTVKNFFTSEKFSDIEESLMKIDKCPMNDKEYDYIKHCVNEYILAKEINNANPDIFKDKYIPRLIDTYVLIANSDFSANQELLD